MITVRKFRENCGIWFVIHMDDNGDITGYEYHNWREGGFLDGTHTSEEWEAKFLREVEQSYSDEEAVDEAKLFLADLRKELTNA